MKFFSLDSPFSRALSYVGDMIILNVIFLLCCMPVVTVGASAAALYTVTMRMAAKDDRGIIKPFFRAFKENFKKATVIWLIFLLTGGVIGLGVTVIYLNSASFPWFIKAVYGLVVFVYLIGLTWVFPLQAKFENTVKMTIKNAFVIGISRPGKSVVIIVLMLVPVLLALFFTYYFIASGFIWFMFGFSGIAILQSLVINKGLRPFIEQSEDGGSEDGNATDDTAM